MENHNISELARILREYGDKVLNSESKLTLSESLLDKLSSSFLTLSDQRDAMSSSFQVINNSNIRTDYFRDLQFLHDFVQKTSSLKLVMDAIPSTDILDICIFKNLKLLELHRVNVKKVRGIQFLCAQIQFLVCHWVLDTLSEILERCGYDESQGLVWSNLKEANFSYNNIYELDNSLKYAPRLHTLDLSHNRIKDGRPLNCLVNLKYLNLSYNQMESVPSFRGQICSRLQVLILNNNFIESIGSLLYLANLCELDLSENCLLDHNCLVPLSYLATLQCLSLEGNPLSFHPQHRSKTLSYLHINTTTVKFLLDHKVVLKAEAKQCGKIKPIHNHREHLESFSSSVSNSTVVDVERSGRVRTASITEGNEISEMGASVASIASLLTSSDHLETKRTIEELRKQYGQEWLRCEAGSLVQDVLGLEKSLPISSSPYGELGLNLETSDVVIHPTIKELKENSEIKSEASMNGTETYTTASETTGVEEGPYAMSTQLNLSRASTTDDEDCDLGEGEESLYLVTPKDGSEPIFLVVTNTHIWERDCNSGKEKTRWPIETLIACSMLGQETFHVYLEFDTVKRNKQNREYQIEDKEEAKKLSKLLNNFLLNQKSRIISFKCMKCNTQFGEEKRNRMQKNNTRVCPTCKSTLVIEDDEEE